MLLIQQQGCGKPHFIEAGRCGMDCRLLEFQEVKLLTERQARIWATIE